jgi:hypothetical protein
MPHWVECTRKSDGGKVWVNLDSAREMVRHAGQTPHTIIKFIGDAYDRPSILAVEEEPAALVRGAE